MKQGQLLSEAGFNSVSHLWDWLSKQVWIDLVLWHINHCWLSNAKSCFYIYIKYMICKHFEDTHS